MTEQTYSRACDLADVIASELPLPHPNWAIIGKSAIRLGRIALVQTLRIDRLKRGLSPN